MFSPEDEMMSWGPIDHYDLNFIKKTCLVFICELLFNLFTRFMCAKITREDKQKS
jgi:hypothetical protein